MFWRSNDILNFPENIPKVTLLVEVMSKIQKGCTEEMQEMPEHSGDYTTSVKDRFDSNRDSKRDSMKFDSNRDSKRDSVKLGDEFDTPGPNSMIPWPSWGETRDPPEVFKMTGTSRPNFEDRFIQSDRQDGSGKGQD